MSSDQPTLDFGTAAGTRTDAVRVLLAPYEPLAGSSSARPCRFCGAVIRHPRAKQRFCRDACRIASWKANAENAEAEAHRLKALAAEKCREEITIARWAALMVLMRHRQCIVSDVRDYLDVRGIELGWARNWPGSLFQHQWFTATGRRKNAFHVQANARKVNEYRLSEAGHAMCHGVLAGLAKR